MTKSVFIFTILVVFVVIAVWFVIQKTREAGKVTETPTPTLTTTPETTEFPDSVQNQPIRHDNGLVVLDVVVGDGATAETGDTLNAHYIGKLQDGTVFDESYGRGQPIQFVLGSGQLIQGWELGLVGMKEGGKRQLIIPPELGYGERGAGNAIPPNATLLFEIELVGVTKK